MSQEPPDDGAMRPDGDARDRLSPRHRLAEPLTTARPGQHETRLRVRYRDTDAMGVVYYANYLAYFEAARVELLRALGIDYRALEEQGLAAPVSEATCRYRAPARFDDLLVIRTRVAALKRVSFAFAYEVVRETDGALIAHGRTDHACVRLDTLRPVPLPADIRQRLAGLELQAGG